ncbi:pyruvate kinase [Thiomicrorhabdus xiamenensis]|uniref:pyruvate kinase n=1 Tax=Thiomicrorhabdus xiamenensis TaxID=2739063 RepID=A0A7D4SIX0_9GAMM|nr:pyruvate kinase [Thiomicrorhabdus xiamenensis]QKI90180.1 pyruvate kinase [Thiomicrorhabdus xiamenensis]
MHDLKTLYDELLDLKKTVAQKTGQRYALLPAVDDTQVRLSRLNILDYLHLRAHDLSEFQPRLIKAGLASLSRLEPGVMYTLDSMLALLRLALNIEAEAACREDSVCMIDVDSSKILRERSMNLFGPTPREREASIMVTLPSEAAWSDELVKELLSNGMNIARINTAHDDIEIWQAMADQVRRLSKVQHKSCKIMVDLTGPKLRTGPLAYEPSALHIKVKRNLLGVTTEPGKVLLHGESRLLRQTSPELAEYQLLPVPDRLLTRFKSGDKLSFQDSRGKRREIVLVEGHGPFFWKAICFKPAYIQPDTEVQWKRKSKHKRYKLLESFTLSHFSGTQVQLRVFCGDHIYLTKDAEPADWGQVKFNGQWRQMARIGCQVAQPLQNLKMGDPVWIDDGKVGTRVAALTEEGVILQVTEAGQGGVKLKADKGINFPQTELGMSGLSNDDRQNLDWIAENADLIGLSFVQTQQDMDELIDELIVRGREQVPILAKIETAKGLHNLPEILLQTLGRHPLGIMIARGDLAVELGSVRMAEMQEEILSLCEAAHVPVVWATQVLETLAKKGVTSRPELTDAAVSVRAECVMLNKGPYITDAVRVLSDILSNMQNRTHKKVSLLKPLKWDEL